MRDAHQASIGAQIARLRERQGWSQRALARWVGIDQSAVSRIEAGRRRLSADELQRFAGALHVTADVLLAGDPAGAPAGSETDVLPASHARMPLASEHARGLEPGAGPEPPRTESRRLDATAPLDSAWAPFAAFGVSAREASLPDAPARPAGLPDEVAGVAHDWFSLRLLAEAPEPAQRWSTATRRRASPSDSRARPPPCGTAPRRATCSTTASPASGAANCTSSPTTGRSPIWSPCWRTATVRR